MKVSVWFILGEERYAFRSWAQVPRVGEFVVLRDHEAKAEPGVARPFRSYRVTSVEWGDTQPDREDGAQTAYLVIEPNS